jgi:hypothetical protein
LTTLAGMNERKILAHRSAHPGDLPSHVERICPLHRFSDSQV